MSYKFGNVQIFSPKFHYDFMRHRKIWVGISVVLVLASFVIIGIKGINYSIDFLGGAEVTVTIKDQNIKRDQVLEAAESANVGKVEVTTFGDLAEDEKKTEQSYLIRLQKEREEDTAATTAKVEQLVQQLKAKFTGDKIAVGSVTNISGKIGKEEQMKGYMSVLLALVGILAYVSIRFDSRFAPGAVLCLFHDVVVALGFMTLFDRPFSTSSIAAFLTIVGYSINDTIIVYDRIREVMAANPRMPLVDVVNQSISQTMNRTLITSGTGLIALLILTLVGGGGMFDFALTMLIGIGVGTYSSIYVAAPLTLMMDDFMLKRGWKKVEGDKKQKKPEEDPNYIPPVVLKKRK